MSAGFTSVGPTTYVAPASWETATWGSPVVASLTSRNRSDVPAAFGAGSAAREPIAIGPDVSAQVKLAPPFSARPLRVPSTLLVATVSPVALGCRVAWFTEHA